MRSFHDPEPPAADLWCARCGHGYMAHTPGGSACLWWAAPDAGTRCACPAFRYVSAYGGAPELLPGPR